MFMFIIYFKFTGKHVVFVVAQVVFRSAGWLRMNETNAYRNGPYEKPTIYIKYSWHQTSFHKFAKCEFKIKLEWLETPR